MKFRLLPALAVLATICPANATVSCFDGIHHAFHEAMLRGRSLVSKLKQTNNHPVQHSTDAPLREWVFHRYPQQSFSSLSWSGVWFDKEDTIPSSLKLKLTVAEAGNLSNSQLCSMLANQWGGQLHNHFESPANHNSEAEKFIAPSKRQNNRLIGSAALNQLFHPQKLYGGEELEKAQQLSSSQLRAALLKTWGSQLN